MSMGNTSKKKSHVPKIFRAVEHVGMMAEIAAIGRFTRMILGT